MIGERLKQIRKGKCLNLKAFAAALSTSPGFISEVENSIKMPGYDLLSSLKRIYDVDLNWLMLGEQPGIAAEPTMDYLPRISPREKRKLKLAKMLIRIIDEGDEKKIKAVEAQLDLLDPGEKNGE